MKVQKNFFNHFFYFRYQIGFETLMKGNDFIFGSAYLLY